MTVQTADPAAQNKNGSYKKIITEGMMTEAMTTFTNPIILTAIFVLIGASNLTIGVVAALPVFSNLFQLVSIWLVGVYNNRRMISVLCSVLARIPLLLLGIYIFTAESLSSSVLIALLFVFYLFGSIAGPSWNSWMKDFIPEEKLGAFFSRRTMYMQIVSLVLFLAITGSIELVKKNWEGKELVFYGGILFLAGVIGLSGAFLLSKVPEPKSHKMEGSFLSVLGIPLRDMNFRGLLIFQSVWAFAFGMTNPFFAVYQLTTLEFSVTKVLLLSLVGQFTGILLIKRWGALSDRYSNKTILMVLVPVFMLALILWCFLDPRNNLVFNTILVIFIQFLLGSCQSGITQCINNITLKLSPSNLSIVYLSTKNMLISVFASFAPIVGGILADSLADYHFEILARYNHDGKEFLYYVVSIQEWTFLFLIGAIIVYIASQLLNMVKEKGETEKDIVVDFMRARVYNNIKTYFAMGSIISRLKSFSPLNPKKMSQP